MDDAARAQEAMEVLDAARGRPVHAAEAEATGYCLWCDARMAPNQRWCDAACFHCRGEIRVDPKVELNDGDAEEAGEHEEEDIANMRVSKTKGPVISDQ